MAITKEYYATFYHTGISSDRLFVNPDYKYIQNECIFIGTSKLEKDIKLFIDESISEGETPKIHVYERDVTTWKKYNGSVAGVLPNVQFGIFERKYNKKNWVFVHYLIPQICGIDEYYYFDHLSAEAALKEYDSISSNIAIYTKLPKSEGIIMYREVSDWKETII